MQRIIVIGSAGAGKSTLSQKLGQALDLPVVHLDAYFWKPGWVQTESEEWEQIIRTQTEQEKWIMDGNYTGTLDMRLERADTVIFLDMPRVLCVYRVLKRRIQYHGRARKDMNQGCPEKLDWPFISWVWNFPKRSRSKVIAALEGCKAEKQVIVLNGRKEVRRFIERIAR